MGEGPGGGHPLPAEAFLDDLSFKFSFVPEKQLTADEKRVFEQTDRILSFVGGRPENVKDILISKTMRLDLHSYREALGLWAPSENRIVIKRDQLKNL